MRDIEASQFGGLRPRAWICVGSGFSREEVKTQLLARGIGLTQDSVQNLASLCEKILVASGRAPAGGLGWLGPHAREEGLRSLIAEPRIGGKMPELRRLKRQKTFFKKLDRSLQAGRKVAAHEEEALVLDARLKEKLGPNPIREELMRLAAAYDGWLAAMSAWDEPRALREAVEALREGTLSGLRLPGRILRFTVARPEGLEQEFWDLFSRQVECSDYVFTPLETRPTRWEWERWHTLDDAADALADKLAPVFSDPLGGGDVAVLIPDQPAIRRSLTRAFADRGIPLADPRDPTRLRTDENIKAALLPIEVVARGFEREKVIAWLKPKNPKWIQEIVSRGIRNRLSSYSGGALESVHSRLAELEARIGGKKTLAEVREAHLELLRVQVGSDTSRDWVVEFFDSLWQEFQSDLDRVKQGARRAPLLYWLERIQARLEDATPPAEKVRPSRGVALYRLSQAPLVAPDRLFVLGLPPQWLDGEGAGDTWFSESEREALASEFAIRSRHQVREERIQVLKAWIAQSSRVTLLDAAYEWDGSEREGLVPTLKQLDAPEDLAPADFGAHSRWLPSFGAVPGVVPAPIELDPDSARLQAGGTPVIRATELDRYSRCGFVALAQSRWKLSDLRVPEADLWPDVKGNILHAAVRILLENRGEGGVFGISVEGALSRAWIEERPKGLLRGGRLEDYAKKKLVPILEKFVEKESEYASRSGTRVLSLEGPELELEYPEFKIIGRPDRVDEHPEGVFVLDYKTSASLPSGRDMMELGTRLQLPFYALAARRHFGKDALGVQFVELSRRASRSAGIFFKKHNGKDPGKLTATTASSKSLLDLEPDDVWSRIEDHVIRHAKDYLAGRFEARPKDPQECSRCMLSDACGWRRRAVAGLSESSDAEGGAHG